MPLIDFNPNTMPTQVFNPNTTKFDFSIFCKKGATEGWCDPWCQRPWRGQGGRKLKKRTHSDNGWEVWWSFQMCCTDRCVRENEISGKDQVMGKMKVHKMKNRKKSESISIKGKFSCRSMGKEMRTNV